MHHLLCVGIKKKRKLYPISELYIPHECNVMYPGRTDGTNEHKVPKLMIYIQWFWRVELAGGDIVRH